MGLRAEHLAEPAALLKDLPEKPGLVRKEYFCGKSARKDFVSRIFFQAGCTPPHLLYLFNQACVPRRVRASVDTDVSQASLELVQQYAVLV